MISDNSVVGQLQLSQFPFRFRLVVDSKVSRRRRDWQFGARALAISKRAFYDL